jgi:CubicO group peptidase (beta-lactamase class C family)
MITLTRLIGISLCMLAVHTLHAQQFAQAADSIRKSRFVASLSYAVISTEGIVESANTGYIKLRTRDTVGTKARYHIGGNAVQFASFIAARLVADGKLAWNTKLVDVYPDLLKSMRPEYKELTLVDLLSMRSGFPRYNTIQDVYPQGFPGDAMQRRKSFTEWLVKRRGTTDSLSGKKPVDFTNAATSAAISMLEKVTGKNYDELLQVYINKPMGISIQYGFPNRISDTEPWGHSYETGNWQPTPPDHWWKVPLEIQAAADVNITVRDYAVFMLDQLRGACGQKALMPSRSYELLQRVYSDYAIGWGNVKEGNYQVNEHDGTMSTFYCHVELHKDRKFAIITMSNVGGVPGKAACLNLAKYIRDHIQAKQ